MVTLNQQLPRLDDESVHLEKWFQLRFQHFPVQKQALLKHACQLARLSGESTATPLGASCFEEGLKMADILLSLELDIDTIAAALICNCAQYGDLSLEDISEHLGESICTLTQGFLKMSVINSARNQQQNPNQINNIRKMVLAMVADVRVVLIKLAERICLMRHIKFLKTNEAKRLAQETYDIYAPLANRLGISQMKWELEDLCFFYLDNEKYKHIAKALNEKRIDRDNRLNTVKSTISAMLDKRQTNASLYGRSKHIYSIHQKMSRKNLALEEIYDASALRIIVDNIDQCYAILAEINAKWAHIPEEFDDYIANPKPNGYKSIHTVIIGPSHKNIEIQIRTHKMHEEAEMGFAAHWVYKEGKRRESSNYEEKISRLRQLLEWHKEIAHGNEPIEQFHDQVFEDRIYVFTPNGDIVDLPKNATPLDFAYRIHSSIGHRCKGAKINNRIVPLNYALNTGETIHVLTAKIGAPSRDWLNPQLGYVVTSRARAKIQHWFNLQDHDHHLSIGENLLDKEISRLGLRDVNHKKLAEQLNYASTEDMIAALGKGSLRVGQLVNALTLENKPIKTNIVTTTRTSNPNKPSGVTIEGVGNLLSYFANCCKPIVGDKIIGYITQGRGVAIHRQNCPNIKNVASRCGERLIDVNWGNKTTKTFKADLLIITHDRTHLLRDITNIFSHEKINLLTLNTQTRKITVELRLTIEIQDLAQLSHVLEKITQLNGIISANRIG